jgi:hypothetical protein
MPSTTPDLSMVTGGCSSLCRAGAGDWRSAPASGSVNVDGARPLRRGGCGVSPALDRSDFGQASSNLGGDASVDSGTGGAAAAGRSATGGSAVRASARSRSFRDEEENSRLRLCLGAGAAGSGAAGASNRPRSRDVASSCHGGGILASAVPAGFSAGCWSRANGNPRSKVGLVSAPIAGPGDGPAAWPDMGTPAPSRRAISFKARTTIQMPSRIAPVQAPMTPVRIRVFPKLNSLTGIPKPIARRPASKKPIPAINKTAIIESPPGLKYAQAAYATIPSYWAHRQRPIESPVPVKKLI